MFGTIVDGDSHPEYGLFGTKQSGEGGILQLQYGEYARIVATCDAPSRGESDLPTSSLPPRAGVHAAR